MEFYLIFLAGAVIGQVVSFFVETIARRIGL